MHCAQLLPFGDHLRLSVQPLRVPGLCIDDVCRWLKPPFLLLPEALICSQPTTRLGIGQISRDLPNYQHQLEDSASNDKISSYLAMVSTAAEREGQAQRTEESNVPKRNISKIFAILHFCFTLMPPLFFSPSPAS